MQLPPATLVGVGQGEPQSVLNMAGPSFPGQRTARSRTAHKNRKKSSRTVSMLVPGCQDMVDITGGRMDSMMMAALSHWDSSFTVYQGRIQEFWLEGGRGFFFFQRHGVWGRLKAPSGSRATPWWRHRGRSHRKLLNFSDFRSKI